jgi:hypothetical protein
MFLGHAGKRLGGRRKEAKIAMLIQASNIGRQLGLIIWNEVLPVL